MKVIRNILNQNAKAKPLNSSSMVGRRFNSTYPVKSLVCLVLLGLVLNMSLKTEVLCYP